MAFPENSEALTAAEGYHDLGMHEDAWNALEDLPTVGKTEPLVLELRLRILTAMECWELAELFADVLVNSTAKPLKCRERVARFRHAYARSLCSAGSFDDAQEQIELAMDAWMPIRREIVYDKTLDAVWN